MMSNSTADGHSHTGSQNKSASRISIDRPKTKSNEGFVYTKSQIKLTFIYTNFLSF